MGKATIKQTIDEKQGPSEPTRRQGESEAKKPACAISHLHKSSMEKDVDVDLTTHGAPALIIGHVSGSPMSLGGIDWESDVLKPLVRTEPLPG